jgi:hypothetical protein
MNSLYYLLNHLTIKHLFLFFSLIFSNFLFAQPVITGFSPSSGQVGTTVTISGSGFSTVVADNIVYFGAVKATVTAASTTSLTVTVPPQSTPQPISVTRNLLTGYSIMPFLVTFPGGEAPFHSLFFENRVDSTVNGFPQAYCASDLDGDGKPDLALVKTGLNNQPGPLSIYRNTGSAGTMTFAPALEIPLSMNASNVKAVDLNGDGKPDLVVGSFTRVFINTSTPGAISFKAGYSQNYAGPVATADFDGDGKTDLATMNYSGVTVLRNMAVNDTVFFYEYNFSAGLNVYAIDAADLSGDGKAEIILVSRHDKTVYILRNNSTPGNISFVKELYPSTGKYPSDVATADVDNDGKLDIAIVDYLDSTVSIYRNSGVNGALGFQSAVKLRSGWYTNKLAFKDLNGDGKPDISLVNKYDSTIAIYKNISTTGTVAFEEAAVYKTDHEPVFVDAADWDGDGLHDLTVVNSDQTFSFFKNKLLRPVISSFTPAVVMPGATVTINGYNFNNTAQVKLGAVNAQSFTIVSNNQITAIAGEGAEGSVSITSPKGTDTMSLISFATPVITSVSPEAGVVGTTVTIIGSNFSTVRGNNHVYFGSVEAVVTSATTTSLTVQVPAGALPYQPVSVSTFNKMAWSSKPFLVTFDGIGNSFTTESFAGKIDFNAQKGAKSVCSGDLDGDGLPDVVVANYVEESLSILKNNGSNGKVSFEAAVNIPFLQDPVVVKMVDINADGKLDVIAISHVHGLVEIRLNNSTPGHIQLAQPLRFDFSDDVLDFVAADFDQDGRTDLIVLRDDFITGQVGIMQNTSANGVISFIKKSFHFPSPNVPKNIAVADLNADGRPDLLVSSDSYSRAMIYRNISTIGDIEFNLGPVIEFGIDGPDGLIAGDVDGDGKPELVVAASTGGVFSEPAVSIFKNTSIAGGAISFGTVVDLKRPSALTTNLYMGDMDGDGKIDIVAPASNDSVMVYKNTSVSGNISFLPKVSYEIDQQAEWLCLVDIDTDGKTDIISANTSTENISVLRNRTAEPLVVPSGINPVSGTIANKVVVDPTVQTLNGNAYVQRHYDIMPENNAGSATATVTLFFTQQEFDSFNAYAGHGADLPKHANDAAGKANIRIYQYHGFSTTSLPGTYTGQGKEIDPDDANIVWNAARQWWEITFTVQGFSGFFLSTAGFNYNQVPAPVITASSATSFCVGGSVELIANIGIGNQWYKDGAAINSANGTTYQTNASGAYTVTATNNGLTSPQSTVITVQVNAMPAKPVITQNGGELVSSIATGNQWYLNGTLIPNATGQVCKPTATGNYSVKVTNGGCAGPESEKYNYLYTAIIDLSGDNFISLTPNPVIEKAYLKFTLNGINTLSVQVFNLQGQVGKSWNNLSTGATLDLATLPGGIYFVRVMSSNGKLNYTFRLLKL